MAVLTCTHNLSFEQKCRFLCCKLSFLKLNNVAIDGMSVFSYYGQNQNNLLVKRQTDNTTPGVNAKRKKTAKIKERKVKYRAKSV